MGRLQQVPDVALTVVQAWMTGIIPELDDQSPLRLLRDGQPEQIGPGLLRATRTFIAGG